MLHYTSPLSFYVSFLQIIKLLEWTCGYIWSKVPPKSFYTPPLSSKDIFFWSKRVMRMNPRVYLIQSTATVILHISTEFQGDFCRIKELLERTHGSKAPSMSFYKSPLRSNDIILQIKSCLNISLSFRGICLKIIVPLSSKDIFLEIKEFLEWTHQ